MSLLSQSKRPAAARAVRGTVAPVRAAPKVPARDRAHQQAAVAALGQAALTGVDIPTLLEQAAVFVAQTLSIELCAIYQFAEDKQTLRMAAGFGWNLNLQRGVAIDVTDDSLAACILRSPEPVIVTDLNVVSGFTVPQFVRDHGVVSSISVTVPGSERPWGIIETQSRSPRTFVEDDFHFLQSVANVISTAHARKQNELEREELAQFVEQNPNPVVELSADGKIIYANDAARAAVNALGKSDIVELLPAGIPGIVTECLGKGARLLDEQAQIAGRTFAWSFFPVPASARVHGYAIDTTERLSLEAQLRQSQKMEAIGQLAAGVAHDFNNILTIMQGLVRRLGLSASREQGEMLDQLFETTERAASLTRQLLAFSRRQVMQPRVLMLHDVVANMSRMLQRLIGEDVTLTVESATGVPPVEADAAMLEQVVLNLAVNARDAMPRGGSLVVNIDSVRGEGENDGAKWVRLRVTDSGCGMPPEVQARIFEPFFTTKEVGKGTGLGLATVFGIVKQHSGAIDLASEVGRGTTFTILLPATDKPLEAKAVAAAPITPQRGAGETILLVEDEPLLRELAHTILADAGYQVIEAERGEEALRIWEERREEIDVLLTDMVLPGGLNGRELAVRLQQGKPHLKVIYTTGYSQDVVDPGGDTINFLQKPYPPETLMRTVRTCLDTHG